MGNTKIRVLWFAFGVSIGVLGVIYLGSLLRPETPVSANKTLPENNPSQLISIKDDSAALSKRKELIDFIWGQTGLPTVLPDKIETAIADERYASVGNLKQINRLTVSMEWGLTSIAYVFIPTTKNDKLLIYQQGHDGDFLRGIETIRFFLSHGFTVIALSMPMEEPNNHPIVDLKGIGKIELSFHEQLKLLEMKSGHPVQLFLTPIAASLNYAKTIGFESAEMTGYSGGGWTTTMYAAVDPRVTHSYPVAGSLPLYLRTNAGISNTAQRSADWGDYEQTIPELYRIANYLDLYVLGAYGSQRRQLQILNQHDPCCFAGNSSQTYENVVKDTVKTMGSGSFSVYLDTSNKKHDISEKALAVILEDINSGDATAQK